ncbi:hypothetical protein KO489_14630 [Reinekea forsetii]|nr:hypothetical protein [Reinekea forsetii]
MNKITQHPLKHLASLSVQGHDAFTFLQGQCTQDLSKIPDFGALPGAFCTPKGRVVANVWIHKVGNNNEAFELVCHESIAEVLYKHLKKYVPFFRGTTMTASPTDELQASGHLGLGEKPGFMLNEHMSIELHSQLPEDSSATPWQIAEIENGVLWLSDSQSEQWIPQNVNLDSLNAVSFSKGCYTGQEVVARLHYKGSSKKRLFAVKSTIGFASKSLINQEGKAVGDVIQHIDAIPFSFALVVMKTEAAESPIFVTENEQVSVELLHSF